MTSISALWTRLDPVVQQWLLRNPGTGVLPRTQVNRVEKATGHALSVDEHGEHWFSLADLVFLKARRHAASSRGNAFQPDPDGRMTDADPGSNPYEEALDR
ncbi:hypothetical protein [Arthrobacter sp. Br18]|uniref:hypothetical protein n=1 Tax=Arthrobacter sp. Br18 TaxID=1312954 RepID=UPI0006871928|nr:hypothetical protein [Arthrobacter sp. Br18]